MNNDKLGLALFALLVISGASLIIELVHRNLKISVK